MGTQSLETEIKEQLMASDHDFKTLAEEHRRCEERLRELADRPYPTEAELFEQATLKKRKLLLKDKMQSMINRHLRERTI